MDQRLDPEVFWPTLTSALEGVPVEATRPPPEARVGAVLVLLEDTAEGPSVVLTRRRRDMRSHPGQLSFPGGRLDAGETIEQAAVREAEEEVALRPESVEVVGAGPKFYIPPSRFWVVPVLARWRDPHELVENPWEVDAVLQVPLTQLLERDRLRHTPLSLEGSAWAWQLDDDLLWGATAVVMGLLLDTAVPGWDDGMQPADLGDDLAVRPWEHVPAWERRARLEGDLPAVAQSQVPHVTQAQARAVRGWLDERGVDAAARAEQAGRAVAHAVRRMVDGSLEDRTVTILAGPSSNGWAGLVAARLLDSAGADVEVLLVGPPRSPDAVRVLQDAEVSVTVVDAGELGDDHPPGEVVLDALLGIGGEPPLRDLPERVASWLRRHDVPVVALDLPSGLGADVGLRGACVTADVTVAFGAPTVGLTPAIVAPYVGDLYVADLGIPPAAWRAVGADAPRVFAAGPLVRLTAAERATDAGTPDQGEVPPEATARPEPSRGA
ncbi:NAD(P)H-hydrate epimerase [Nitriliruptor alkaliphilus]|uniref:NAD(P)H-hydrate epimerase n=1 Tax=Nitriliruptor alkaliphilus TaxID=427918 RepID=UPI000697B9ED|nr:NAD(P)H-hydrate epimerase [Nitriliruptor alkaliphilus]